MSAEQSFAQYLNYRKFVKHQPGVIELADGAWLMAKAYGGRDQEYTDYLIMEHIAEQINRDLARLSSGWCVQAEVVRTALTLTADPNYSDSPTAQLLAQERAAEYARPNAHFGNRLVLGFSWLPPAEIGQSFSNFFVGKPYVGSKPSRTVLLNLFLEQVEAICAGLSTNLTFEALSSAELKRFLWCCVTGEDREIGADNTRLQYALGAVPYYPHRGLLNGLHTRAVGVYGYPAGDSPQMLEEITNLPFALRLSQRASFMGLGTALEELKAKRRIWGYANWYNWKSMLWRQVKNAKDVDEEVVERNDDADEQVKSVKRAITKLQAGEERDLLYTGVVILRDTDEAQVEEQAQIVMRVLRRKGFSPVLEDQNFPAAFKGSLLGHGKTNVRRTQLTSRDAARLLIWSSKWPGHRRHPSPLYPPNSAPLLICKSTGNTPFAFTPEYNLMIIGQIGSGKSTLLNAMSSAQLNNYPGGQVHTFDYDASSIVPALTHGGAYFNLDGEQFSPLARIDKPDDWSWAYNYLEKLAALRKFPMTPMAQEDLQRALRDLAAAPIEDRHMTGLLGQLQTSESGLQTVLGYYAGDNPGGVLDGRYSPLTESRWLVYDMKEILKRDADVSSAVLLAATHALERRLEGRQTLMTFDEGWMSEGTLLDRYFGQQTATGRKQVISLALVVHAPGDLLTFSNADRILNNVPTRVYLPAPNANSPGLRKHYSDLGLSSREIKMIAEDLRPKRDYYVTEGTERRVFQLTWGPWANAILGKNGRDYRARLLAMQRQHGLGFVPTWLRECGHDELAEQWEAYTTQQPPTEGPRKEAA